MRTRKYTREYLEGLVAQSHSLREVVGKAIGHCGGSTITLIKNRIVEYGIDISHFKSKPRDENTYGKLSYSEVLIKTPKRMHTNILYRAMIESGKDKVCSECGLGCIWNGKPITLQIDHIDGDRQNHTFENVRFLCPNCHTQTKTFGCKNRKTILRRFGRLGNATVS